jgi:glycerol uptake facilitator-like aquaporin
VRLWWLSVLGTLVAGSVLADEPARNVPPPASASDGGGLAGFFSSRTPYEFWLTALIVFFGVIVIFSILMFFRGTAEKNGDRVVRALIVVVIVVGTLVLITAGYSNEQVAPAFGLFGTIVGYFLGRLSSTPATSADKDSSRSEEAK